MTTAQLSGSAERRAMRITERRGFYDPSTGDAANLAKVLIATPSLRAAFFANPTKAIGGFLPPPRYWTYNRVLSNASYLNPLNLSKRWRFRAERALLAKDVFTRIADEVGSKEMTASVNTDSVFAEFFAPIAKVSERSYASIYVLSWLAFAAGVGLIALGAIIGLTNPKGVDSTVLASVFGGSGAVSAIGSVYAMSVRGIRSATYDMARTRVTLTGFAAQLGMLRAIFEGELKKPDQGIVADVTPVSDAISKALTGALAGIEMFELDDASKDQSGGSKPKPAGAATANGSAGKPAAVKKAPAKKAAAKRVIELRDNAGTPAPSTAR